jgi:Raf kinase inhibitor-like YbhB/YbcL family protein
MFSVTSQAFTHLGIIPSAYCTALSHTPPPIRIHDVPTEAVDLALVCWDPDAPLPRGFTHWTVFHVPVGQQDIDLTTSSYDEGPNGLGEAGWTGPEPPQGHGLHHYYFWVYALRVRVGALLTRENFLDKYEQSIFAQTRLIGTFERD